MSNQNDSGTDCQGLETDIIQPLTLRHFGSTQLFTGRRTMKKYNCAGRFNLNLLFHLLAHKLIDNKRIAIQRV